MPNRDSFPLIFESLKKNFQPFAPPLVAVVDTPDNYTLHTSKSAQYRPDFFVGAVQIKKNYVSYHLMPIYVFPDLLDGLSERLKQRMQGKSCFNFTVADEALFTELAQLTAAGFKRFKE
jgi:hypothetical protein